MKRINRTSVNYNNPDFCDLQWVTGFDFHGNWYIAEYFEEAANRLVDSVSENRKGNADDGLFIPIAYLYRHSAELLLKEIIDIALSIGIISEADIGRNDYRGSHNLHCLLNIAEKPIKKVWSDDPDEVFKSTCQVIIDLHYIDINGQGFRYSHDTVGNPTASKYPKNVSLIEFRRLINSALETLRGCALEFRVMQSGLSG